MKTGLLVFLICLISVVSGQKNDYQWLFGYENRSASTDTNFGGVTLDFNYNPVQVNTHVRFADFDEANVSYCDKNGQLLFYSNGGDVFDKRDSIMLGGDSLNFGWDWVQTKTLGNEQRSAGLRIVQGMLALPWGNDSSLSCLIHYKIDILDFIGGGYAYLADTSCFSIIKLDDNGGLGKVGLKNILLNTDTLSYSMLSATKHGNGKDWWIIHPRYLGNCYYTYLLTDTGIGISKVQCVGPDIVHYGALGTSCFSPNGLNYFWVNSADGIRMFDFDRCTGTLSNPQIIRFPIAHFGDSVGLCSGITVSPNSRYLYITANALVLQYDLLAADIGGSVDTVAVWDGTYDPYYPFATTFFVAQLGPDGKIYINSQSSVKSLNVIKSPDSAGQSCAFLQHAVHLNTVNNASIPNFPNYRLGAQSGSACDTLSALSDDLRADKEKQLKVYPNPATDYTIVDYGFTDWSKGNVSMQITNELGQIVHQQNLPMYSGYQKIDISNFASGLYLVAILRKSSTIAVSRFVKE